MSNPSIIYTSFDRVPSHKGAGVHIEAFTKALETGIGPLDLVTIAPTPPLGPLDTQGVNHVGIRLPPGNFMEQVLAFRAHLLRQWPEKKPSIVHFRSIFEGYPIAKHKAQLCDRILYEVNGLPSIEFKYHYPKVAEDSELLTKLTHQEKVCLEKADVIVTPSHVTAQTLTSARGVPKEKIQVIPNGVNTDLFTWKAPRKATDTPMSLLYVGTLTAWQGVGKALEALALLRRDFSATLTLIGPLRKRQERPLLEAAQDLGVLDSVIRLEGLPQENLVTHMHQADAILAPLLPNDRNLVQGCCPLKVLEAMAVGTPLVASDLPVVSDLARGEIDALLVQPGSAKAIKDALLRLRLDPDLAETCSVNARRRVEEHFTWDQSTERLIKVYEELLHKENSRSRIPSRALAS